MCFNGETMLQYFSTRSCTARTVIRLPCNDKNSAFSSLIFFENGVSLSFCSSSQSKYSVTAFATSSEKYRTAFAPPLRVTLIAQRFRSTSFLSNPTHSLIRMPVPRNTDNMATSRFLVIFWYCFCRGVRELPPSARSRRFAISLTSR